ncbi:MAG: hypothetical protein IJ011_08875 [Clostridia bacterium]|nr:hypothetical protein [Clostridia bacterium]
MDNNTTIEKKTANGEYPISDTCVTYRYEAVREELYSDEIGEYTAYGIAVYLGNTRVEFISDLTNDQGEICSLVNKCNENQLDAVHVYDVVEDFLAEVVDYPVK